MSHPSIRCPHCGGQILTLAPTKKLRAALELAGELGPAQARRSRANPNRSPALEASLSPPEAKPSIDRLAVRRTIFKKHGTDTITAAAEWEKWQKDNPE